jgi:pyridinium-3,5-biscarboxylic acid mononucleotide sulfurtransferase
MMTSDLSPELITKRDRLLEILRALDQGEVPRPDAAAEPDGSSLQSKIQNQQSKIPLRVVVAFSGGIDSTVVARAAYQALGDRAVAVTADSPSVPRRELEEARRLAARIGIRHLVVGTEEFANPDYVRNDGTRCYYCKDELYGRIETLLPSLGEAVICSGANLDDQGDYRPGLRAASEHGVRHPLQEAGFTKADVRALARFWGLPTWDKPASPCLSSRLAPGVAVTHERTARVEAAEEYLRSLGFRECRVRLHEGELARVEVPAEGLARLADPEVRAELTARLRALGFQFVTLDLEGFRSGSLNTLVSLETRKLYSSGQE